ncbi:MAG: outer membrane lipid asymmetry maintenance protein MlaD [Alphaproteobacteria bacterium]|nr:outer membrane lipid asymmetry maintenance protein MlaD [Alphaproteobacteria bacterium]
MSRNIVETLMGAVVLAVAVVFVVFAYTRSTVATVSGYELTAKFARLDGLNPGSDIRISGIKVGSVIGMTLDPTSFRAVARLSIDPAYKLPVDSSISVVSDGLLGGKYASVEPGGMDEVIPPGGEIKYTQDSILLEQLIGKFVFDETDKPKNEAPKP